MKDELNTKVFKILVNFLQELKDDERNASHIRENAEFSLDILGVAYRSVMLDEEFNCRHAWKLEEECRNPRYKPSKSHQDLDDDGIPI